MKVATVLFSLWLLAISGAQGRLGEPSSSSLTAVEDATDSDAGLVHVDEKKVEDEEEEEGLVLEIALYSTDHSASSFHPDQQTRELGQRKRNKYRPEDYKNGGSTDVFAPARSPPTVVLGNGRPNTPPQVEILRPTRQGKQYTQDKTVHFRAKGLDTQDGILAGSRISWEVDGVFKATGTDFRFSASDYTPGYLQVAAYAKDSNGATGPRTFFTIEILSRGTPTGQSNGGDGGVIIVNDPFNTPPTVFITSPANGDFYSVNEGIVLRANAFDVQDGDIAGGAAVQWYLTPNSSGGGNRASTVATGPNTRIQRNTLPLGTHTLEAVAQDSRGAFSAPSRVVITVTPDTTNAFRPDVDITQPSPRQVFAITESITLRATPSDRDERLSPNDISWLANGRPIATGRASIPARSLGIGSHTIGAFVTDSTGLTSQVDTVIINVRPVTPPTTPRVAITRPQRNQSFQINQNIPLQAARSGPGTVRWLVNGQSIATTSSIPARRLGVGVHTISAVGIDTVTGLQSDIDTVSIFVVNTPGQNNRPTVKINTPTHAQTFSIGQIIPLLAQASDKDESLGSDSIQWLVDGRPVGSRTTIFAKEIGVGVHTIGAIARDSAGLQSAVDIVAVNIIDPTKQVDPLPDTVTDPVVSINQPSRGTIFLTDGFIEFDASATDREDGFLNQEVQWRSDVEGFLGRGQRIKVDAGRLTLGRHLVTVDVTDSSGRTARDSVPIQITEGPKVTITSPQSGRAFGEGSIALRVTATTWTGGSLRNEDITWYSIHDDETTWTEIATGRSANVPVGDLAKGSHEIVAVAKDGVDLGADSVFISVNAPDAKPARAAGIFPGTVNFRRNIPR